MLAVGDQSRAVEAISGAEANAGGEFVTEEPDQARYCDRAEVVEMARVDEALSRLDAAVGAMAV